jgi:hypothetical protein
LACQNHLASADGCGTAEIMRRSGKPSGVPYKKGWKMAIEEINSAGGVLGGGRRGSWRRVSQA